MLRKFNKLSLLLLPALAPLAANAATDNGVLIQRTSSTQWQIQLYAGQEARQLSAVIESDVAFTSATGFKVESVDSVRLISSDTIGAQLAVWPRGTDGFKFAAPTTAKLCLRDTGSSNVKYYMGDTLATAVAVTVPYALSGANACGTTTTPPPPPPPPPPTSTKKYHPGHYIALMRSLDSDKIMADTIKPGVVGFMKRYAWKQLEPTQGVYDFSEIDSDLAWVNAHGMHLIVMVEDKTFFKGERPTPSYLDAYTFPNKKDGYTAARWVPTVLARQKALVKALGQRFDSNPAFEGISPQEESAPGFDQANMTASAYTPEKYRDALIDLINETSASFPTSRVFWFMNFFPVKQAYVADVATVLAARGGVMGGPDVMPDDGSLQNMAYPYYRQFASKMPLFGQVEPSCYSSLHQDAAPTKYWTMPELFSFARDDLQVDYMLWVRLPTSSPSDAYNWTNALPVISTSSTSFNIQ